MTLVRPRLRFTLRLLLAVVTLLCAGLAIWTHRAREQRRLIERIRQAAGYVVYHGEMSIGPLGAFQVHSALIDWLGKDYFLDVIDVEVHDPALVRALPRLHRLEVLRINSHRLTDDQFAAVASLRHCKAMDIYGDLEDPSTQLTDRSLALLAELPVLELVNLESSRITANGLALLARSKSLSKLYVASPHESLDERSADQFRSCLAHLCIRRSTPGAFGKIVASWYLSSPPGPRAATTEE